MDSQDNTADAVDQTDDDPDDNGDDSAINRRLSSPLAIWQNRIPEMVITIGIDRSYGRPR